MSQKNINHPCKKCKCGCNRPLLCEIQSVGLDVLARPKHRTRKYTGKDTWTGVKRRALRAKATKLIRRLAKPKQSKEKQPEIGRRIETYKLPTKLINIESVGLKALAEPKQPPKQEGDDPNKIQYKLPITVAYVRSVGLSTLALPKHITPKYSTQREQCETVVARTLRPEALRYIEKLALPLQREISYEDRPRRRRRKLPPPLDCVPSRGIQYLALPRNITPKYVKRQQCHTVSPFALTAQPSALTQKLALPVHRVEKYNPHIKKRYKLPPNLDCIESMGINALAVPRIITPKYTQRRRYHTVFPSALTAIPSAWTEQLAMPVQRVEYYKPYVRQKCKLPSKLARISSVGINSLAAPRQVTPKYSNGESSTNCLS